MLNYGKKRKKEIKKENDFIFLSSTCTYAVARKAEADAKRKLKKQQEDAEKERALKEADAIAEKILQQLQLQKKLKKMIKTLQA